ncbi:lipid A core--O-antigen ligase [Enterovibrio norvegicus FF-454]|uniref:Lipid A core--O-antigen ligase n=1 Tax=Enterovibrio norvegicus FF-454 TaxID=1185651 RepID=A0A1E5BXM2_9GAMM|nr:Wzy polymerase domain-containing protein [Enterovibrio norvegicus]OEE58007.1 lipid A core--O-antigen ligase [Enterovibrio norvegicus FF-454]
MVASKPLVKPVLIAMAALFLFCLPLNQIQLAVSGIQHPSIALTFLLAVAIVCFGLWEIARQKRFCRTSLTGWLSLSALFSVVPAFYLHASFGASLWHVSSIAIALLTFSTLQQFSFNHLQRQYLLWLPLLSGWLVAFLFFLPSILNTSGLQELAWQTDSLYQDTASIVLLTSVALSAYLLARTRVYKRNIAPVHILLLATPTVTLCALMALRQAWLVTIAVLIIILIQPFLYRFCRKLHHGLWNCAVFLGFLIAGYADWLPSAALFSPRFSTQEFSVVEQSLALLKSAQFEGVGLGQQFTAQLLFGVESKNVLPMPTLHPSWLVKSLTEGGLALCAGIGLLTVLVIRRLNDAPWGTRLMLTAIMLPSLIGIVVTPFVSVNPALALLFVVLLYWIDNLSARYQRISVRPIKTVKLVASSSLILASTVVLSSVYLGEQALHTYQISDSKLAQYQAHPWWRSFYHEEAGKRAFLTSVERRDIRAQEAYLRQQVQRLTLNPNADDYQSLIELAMLTGNKAMAKQIKQEANSLFPNRVFQPSFSE